jgi:hypothetical protein
MAHVRVTEETTLSGRMARGVVGGILVGVFLRRGWSAGMSPRTISRSAHRFSPISTIVLGDNALNTGEADVAIGVIVHFAIAIFYGMGFRLISSLLRNERHV